jgi:hypothetical protein
MFLTVILFLNIIALWLMIFLHKPWAANPTLFGPEHTTLYLNDNNTRVHSFNIGDIFNGNIQFDTTVAPTLPYYLDIVRNMYYSLGGSFHLGDTFDCNFVNLSSFPITIQNYTTYAFGGAVNILDQWKIVNGTGQTIVIPANSSQLVEFVFSSINSTTNQVIGTAYVIS